ncbi:MULTISPECIES: thiamine-phosphate kinase [Shewanella]|uniref:Thiamine-monophosphate kinase n=1 Tax=Shewanella vesiculosa TaxID=518738 RepID=A0ABV0FJU0_9GAMM|nr:MULTISPECIES: thiamine-phosphate kinase [Shewanella]NCQ45658.1 thiamine-phosphate kinase [Shewanella frigidimarina]NCO71795.1 thiamine-phosphate kinase [Shewanella vesiculosa]NCP37706.1 thiamine-phosphate kinase [Shewanella vesiculosa]NCP69436.1 thiamine-phosphate kinase [Shewanella vesiculosa]NCP75327.1 thiamine-phosphate kinase [Shewanella vesiculosa]
MKEFQLIEHYFRNKGQKRRDVELSIGDDCALVNPADNKSIAISCDTLVEGVHFLADIPAHALGYKSLAVNLSDLAAMGAEPAWFTLALTLPSVDQPWLASFSEGLFEIAEYYGIALIGGDTTRGPRSISITINGQVIKGTALTRAGAKNGDWIYVTGTLGDSALGLDILRGAQSVNTEDKEYLINRHYYPTPRVLAGQALRTLATSAIDLSDGLISDIGHVLTASKVGATIDVNKIPLSKSIKANLSREDALSYALTGGEDYELLFTVPESQRGAINTALIHAGVKFVKIGQICAGDKLKLVDDGQEFNLISRGFVHF